jgi:WD40 repeat protein/tetratricopeptide (TPR) repeat protein
VTHAAFLEMLRAVREEEPPRPSARISTVSEEVTAISMARHTDPVKLRRTLRRDLDWIVMKALAKDRTRRYQTTGDLVRDIEHFLHNEPVEARPPRLLDRLAKWSRRHRQAVWASVAILGVVLVASLTSALLIADAYKQEKTQRIAAQESETRALNGEALAKQQESRAKQQENIANQQKAEAERQRDAAERSLYAANMQVASHNWILGQCSALEANLEAQLPKPGRPDHRGWEWYYLFSQSHRERFVLPHQYSFGWSPDGKFLATADFIGLVNIWDAAGGERKASLKGTTGSVRCLSWSPDGKHLAASTDRGKILIWEFASGKVVRSLSSGGAAVHSIAWSPDGLRLAAGEGEGIFGGGVETGESRIRIWDWRSGATLSSLVALGRRANVVAWHTDGRRLLALCTIGSLTELSVWDTASGREIAGWPSAWESRAAFSPDGRRLVWGLLPVRVTDRDSLVVSSRDNIAGPGTWGPGRDRFACTGLGGAIKIWDAASGEELDSIFADLRGAWRLSWSPKSELLAAPYPDGTIRIWDTTTGRRIINPGRPDDSSHWTWVLFSPDGKRLLVGGNDRPLRICDAESGQVLLSANHAMSLVRSAVWSPDGKRFAARTHTHAGTRGQTVQIFDARTGEAVLPPLQCEYDPGSLAWSPDGSTLAVGHESGRIILFSASTGRRLAAADSGGAYAPTWSPDGKWLAAGGPGALRVWDSALHPQPQTFTASPQGYGLAWSPDSKKLVSGNAGGTMVIYDAATGTPLHVLQAHGYVQAVRWHPWMPRIASGGRDGMIRIWDSSTGQELCALQTHNAIVRDLDWSRDGWRLVSTGGDGSVRIWDAAPADRFFKRHDDLRARVWKLVADFRSRERKGAMRPELQEALDLLEQLRALHPEEKDLQWQAHCVEWVRAVQLARAGQTDEAISIFERLTAEAPDLPDYRLVLPGELFDAAREVQAISLLETWVAEFPQRPEYHEELAFLYERRAIQLCQADDLPGAIAILRKLAKEFPERPGHRSQVVRRLTAQLPREQAIGVFRKLAQEFPDAPEYRDEARVRVNLGDAMIGQGKYSDAEAEYREALRVRPNYPEAHARLGMALACQGKEVEAEAEYRQALDLRPGVQDAFIYPSFALRVQQQKYAAAAHLLAAALAAEPKVAADPREKLRYYAACAAALAGCGQGSDIAELDNAERARLRRQALDWLRADLTAWGQLLEQTPDQARSLVQERMQHWQGDSDFSGVRGDEQAKLPEAERQAWHQLWKDVEQMLKRVNH